MLFSLVSHCPEETMQLGRIIGEFAYEGMCVALRGELGTGKTVLAKGIAEALEIPPENVLSPTFTIARQYEGKRRFCHIDLYRLSGDVEAEASGLEEYMRPPWVTAVEWPERAPGLLPPDTLHVHLVHAGENVRRVDLTACGEGSTNVLYQIRRIGGLERVW